MRFIPGPFIPALLVASGLQTASGLGWQAVLRHQEDSENLLDTWQGRAAITDLAAPFGNIEAYVDGYRYAILENGIGLRDLSGNVPGFGFGYVGVRGPYGFIAGAGLTGLSGWTDYTYAAELSRYWMPWETAVLRARAGQRGGIDKDNPIQAALGLRSHDFRLALALEWKEWVFELGGGARFFPGVPEQDGEKVLQDTALVSDLPGNRIFSSYAYCYRPFWKRLTLGVFASQSDSRRDFHRLTRRTPPPNPRETYMFFPYDTPIEALAAGGIVGVDFDFESAGIGMGIWSFKLTLPFYSERNQLYESNIFAPPNALPYSAYQVFHGGEPWTGEVKLRKSLSRQMELSFGYKFFLKPYLEYGFFDSQSYRLHALEIKISG